MSLNPLNLIEQLIREHGSSSILRERLLLLKDKLAALEEESSDLKHKLADAQKEISDMRAQIENNLIKNQFVEHRGAFFKRKPSGGYDKAVYCPHCQSPLSSLEKNLPYYCERCLITLDFNGKELDAILKELENSN